jgi:lipid-binding SYLF domain-containing protein
MKKHVGLLTCLAIATPLFSQQKENERIANSTTVLRETLDKIPPAIVRQSLCVAVFPSVKKVAFGVGASYGRGVLVCRKNEQLSGDWGAPIMYSLDQGSLGVQIGSTATDFVLTVMTPKAAERALSGKAKLGSDAAVAAGPVGSQASAYSPDADFLTYSRTKGVFAGVSLSGASVEPDTNANKSVYGKDMTAKEIVNTAPILPSAEPLIALLNQAASGHRTGGF